MPIAIAFRRRTDALASFFFGPFGPRARLLSRGRRRAGADRREPTFAQCPFAHRHLGLDGEHGRRPEARGGGRRVSSRHENAHESLGHARFRPDGHDPGVFVLLAGSKLRRVPRRVFDRRRPTRGREISPPVPSHSLERLHPRPRRLALALVHALRRRDPHARLEQPPKALRRARISARRGWPPRYLPRSRAVRAHDLRFAPAPRRGRGGRIQLFSRLERRRRAGPWPSGGLRGAAVRGRREKPRRSAVGRWAHRVWRVRRAERRGPGPECANPEHTPRPPPLRRDSARRHAGRRPGLLAS